MRVVTPGTTVKTPPDAWREAIPIAFVTAPGASVGLGPDRETTPDDMMTTIGADVRTAGDCPASEIDATAIAREIAPGTSVSRSPEEMIVADASVFVTAPGTTIGAAGEATS